VALVELVIADIQPARLQQLARLPCEADVDHRVRAPVCDEGASGGPIGKRCLPTVDGRDEA
jgi:hypothetical protein